MVGLGTRSAIERAESGNSRPKAARASALPDRRCRASRSAGESDGRDREITNRHTTTPADGGAGRPRSRPRLYAAGPPDGQRLSARGVAPDAQGERPRARWGDGAAVCRTPRREPGRPVRAPAKRTLAGASSRTRLARKGRGETATDWAAAMRG